MAGITVKQQIAASPETVFRQAANLAEWPNYITAVTKVEILTEGEVGKGTRFRETRVMFGKEATEEMEITQFDPPCSYVTEAESCGTHYTTSHRFEPTDDGGTEMTLQFEGRPLGFFAKIMGAMMGLLMTGMLKKTIAGDLEDLKNAVEGTSSADQ